MNTSERIIVESKKLLNVSYVNNGRSTHGLDCAGMVYIVVSRLGKTIPKDDGRMYNKYWWKNEKEERLLNYLLSIGFENVEELSMGDLVLFRLFSEHCPINHCGIMINKDMFIHAKYLPDKKGRITQDNLLPNYEKRIAGYLRYKG